MQPLTPRIRESSYTVIWIAPKTPSLSYPSREFNRNPSITFWDITPGKSMVFRIIYFLFLSIRSQKILRKSVRNLFLVFLYIDTVGAVMPRHNDWQLDVAGIGGVWGRDGRVHGSGAWCWMALFLSSGEWMMQVAWCTQNVNRSIWYLVPLRSCSFIIRPSLTGDRVTDHATDTILDMRRGKAADIDGLSLVSWAFAIQSSCVVCSLI